MKKDKILIFTIFSFFINFSFSQIKFSSVEEIIDFGLSNTPTLKTQKELILTKIKSSKQNIAAFLPQIDFNWNDTAIINMGQSDNKSKNIYFGITQPLFNNGKSKINYLYNLHKTENEYSEYLQNLENYKLTLHEKFYTYLYQSKNIQLKEQFYADMVNQLKIIEFKYDKGLCTKSDYLEYKILTQDLQNELLNAGFSLEILEDEIRHLIYLDSDYEFQINSEIDLINFKPETLENRKEELTSKIIINDPLLKKLKTELEFQNELLKLSNRFFLPSVSLSAGISFSGNDYPLNRPDYSIKLCFSFDSSPWIKSDYTEAGSFTPESSTSLQNRFLTTIKPELDYWSNLKIQKLNTMILEQEIIEKEKELSQYTTRYFQEYENLINQIKSLQESLELKTSKLQLSTFEYESGLITASDLLKANLEVENTKQDLLKTSVQLLLLKTKIFFIAGEKYE